MNCHKCGSDKITYYRQIRKDGEAVITARCENGHIPEVGRPFYPKWKFNITALPPLNGQPHNQPPLFDTPAPRSGMFVQKATRFERMTGEK